jgi:menaquinone-dependent protoporphyrinogen oxidase
MGDQRVLVAFATRAGSTAGIAGAIATVLRHAGFTVDCHVASEVTDVTPYSAVILGSGVFVPSRRSDGGGFLARHETSLAARPVWLYCAGPIGGSVPHGHRCERCR